MEIFGIGTAELIAILIIMLIVAGPKRMIQWAYILGQYTAKARAMWAETMAYVQKEFQQAGVDVELPKEIPTRASLNREISKQVEKAIAPVTKPVQQTLSETGTQLKEIKTQATIKDNGGLKPVETPPSTNSVSSNGSNGSADLGTWSNTDSKEQ